MILSLCLLSAKLFDWPLYLYPIVVGETRKKVIGKQSRPWSDAAECTKSLAVLLQEYVNLIARHT